MTKLLCAASDQSQESVVKLIGEAGDRPLMMSYQSDGTPIVCRHHGKAAIPGAKMPRRTARTMDELMCQCAWYSYLDAFGSRRSALLLQDPLPTTRGKKSEALMSFALDFLVSPRSVGHTSIIVFHCTFDRAPFESLSRLLNQYYIMMAPAFTPMRCSFTSCY